ncbi:queD like 2 [Pseudoalteromonas porphyrae]|uniref:QueD like 2 n=2 Tax=Pseudoalteromonas TaxID=53246 RepID=A0A0N1EK20_9GAMM|nr:MULTISPECIES: VC2046/SO_2500 family protein [Pseudoalteromonas]KPH61726.1 queD like 2 [Pseudoalteromonas porphyrae]KPH93396.1 queD like 2 [Pseudoalteromonas porphyrae]NMR25165.1 queD like 2 [Pseudoalteromonas sp. NEC-BIFX-2020_015]NNG42388.1 queD like 2 [Pseudoalteromonas sp. NEC-BIFX-2020_002]
MQIDDLLITESQLNNRLAISVSESRRGEFALLLAMLSHDALDFSQFHLPKTPIDANVVVEDEDQLRKKLGAGPKQVLAPTEFDMLIGQHNAQRLNDGGMSDLRLRACLAPEPLAIRDDKIHIPLNIIDNCELVTRKRHQHKETQLDNPQMDAAAFYDSLNNEALHQPLHLSQA